MNHPVKILLISFVFSSLLYSQSNDIVTPYNTDSTKVNINSNPLTEIQLMFDEFELHREFNNLKMNISIAGDPNTVWLRTSLSISNTEISNQNFSPHFLSSLEKKYYEDSKFNPVRYVLGMAQAGAVGYLAYKHIKKYGFLK